MCSTARQQHARLIASPRKGTKALKVKDVISSCTALSESLDMNPML